MVITRKTVFLLECSTGVFAILLINIKHGDETGYSERKRSITWRHKYAGSWFNIKMSSYQCRKSHCGDKTILRPSYLHNGISYTSKMTSFYWIRALAADAWAPCVPRYQQPQCWPHRMNVSLSSMRKDLTHCVLMTPYGERDLGQHWLR